jgi:hypothetical protein
MGNPGRCGVCSNPVTVLARCAGNRRKYRGLRELRLSSSVSLDGLVIIMIASSAALSVLLGFFDSALPVTPTDMACLLFVKRFTRNSYKRDATRDI